MTWYNAVIMDVLFTESKIEAQTSSAKTVAKVGSGVSLWCNATGYPKPVVYWTREDRNRRLPDGNQQFWVRSDFPLQQQYRPTVLSVCLMPICLFTVLNAGQTIVIMIKTIIMSSGPLARWLNRQIFTLILCTEKQCSFQLLLWAYVWSVESSQFQWLFPWTPLAAYPNFPEPHYRLELSCSPCPLTLKLAPTLLYNIWL